MSEFWERIWYPDRPEGWMRRAALFPLDAAALLFGAGVAARDAAYSRRWLKSVGSLGIPVVSVGNLNVGGAGKTPAVIYLANLMAGERRVAVLSRGHGRKSRRPLLIGGEVPVEVAGDEPLLIARRCPRAAVFVGRDRVELARRAREHKCDLILLDDGMQYRRLNKDLEIAVVDASAGFGNRRLLPRGPLRENEAALGRADLLWVRADEVGTALPALRIPTIRAKYAPSAAFSPDSHELPLTAIAERAVYAFAGLARPRRFLRTLGQIPTKVVGARLFADHHFFTRLELDGLLRDARAAKADCLVTTEKDRMRLPGDFPAWAIRLDVQVLEGGETLSQRLAVL
jgi:tetraacyldisaccharide 4'-kinase